MTGVQPGEPVTSRSGSVVPARMYVTLLAHTDGWVAQPREFVRGRPTRPGGLSGLQDVDPDATNSAAGLGEAGCDSGERSLAALPWSPEASARPASGRRTCFAPRSPGSASRCREENGVKTAFHGYAHSCSDCGRRPASRTPRRAAMPGRAQRRRDIGRGEADLDLGRRELRLGADGPVDEHGDLEPGVVERGLDQPHGFVADTVAARKLQLRLSTPWIACRTVPWIWTGVGRPGRRRRGRRSSCPAPG